MIVLEYVGRLHVENKILQARILFYFVGKLVGEGGATGFPFNGKLSGGLIIGPLT